MSHPTNTNIDEAKGELADEGNYHLLELALDADFTNSEIKAGLIPTRALFTNLKELAYLSEVDAIITKAIDGLEGTN